MSTEAETAIEDLFNAEIFGIDTSENGVAPIPQAEPEPKPVEEIEAVAEAEEPEEVVQAEETEEAESELAEEHRPEEEVEIEEEEYVSWAKKQFGDDIDLDSDTAKKLAKSAFEKEKMLGKKSEEAKQMRQAEEQRDLQSRIDALSMPGNLTPEEDGWVDEALTSQDPAEWAYNALQADRPDLYATVLNRWASMGEQEAGQARRFEARIIQSLSAPQPSYQESYSLALGQTFQSLGLDIESQGPILLAKAEELGSNHPSVQAMLSPDPTIRQLGTRNVYDLAVSSKTTVQKARVDDDVEARVKEETLRANASGVNKGTAHVEPPKKSAFWEDFDEELKDRGWDGNGPKYGRD